MEIQSKCSYCNTVLKKDLGGAMFCPSCGYRPGVSTATETQDDEKAKQEEEEKKSKEREKWVLVAKILGYGLMGCAVIYMLYLMMDMI